MSDPFLPPPPGPDPSRAGGLSQGPPARALSVGTGDRRVGVLTFLGGILVVAGWLLPALTVRAPFGMHVDLGARDGWALPVLGAFAIAKGASTLWPETIRIRLATPLVTGALLVVLLVLRGSDIQSAIRNAEAQGLSASPGIGFLVEIVGGALVLGAGLLALRTNRRSA